MKSCGLAGKLLAAGGMPSLGRWRAGWPRLVRTARAKATATCTKLPATHRTGRADFNRACVRPCDEVGPPHLGHRIHSSARGSGWPPAMVKDDQSLTSSGGSSPLTARHAAWPALTRGPRPQRERWPRTLRTRRTVRSRGSRRPCRSVASPLPHSVAPAAPAALTPTRPSSRR